MEQLLRKTSNMLFNMNYAGMVFAAFSFMRQSEEKKDVFQNTALFHFGFYINHLLLYQLKFKAYPYHLSVQLFNDCACSVTCLPMYILWARNDYHYYFDKPEGSGNVNELKKKREKQKEFAKSTTPSGVQIIDFDEAEESDHGTASGMNQVDISQVLSDIELKRAKIRQARD